MYSFLRIFMLWGAFLCIVPAQSMVFCGYQACVGCPKFFDANCSAARLSSCVFSQQGCAHLKEYCDTCVNDVLVFNRIRSWQDRLEDALIFGICPVKKLRALTCGDIGLCPSCKRWLIYIAPRDKSSLIQFDYHLLGDLIRSDIHIAVIALFVNCNDSFFLTTDKNMIFLSTGSGVLRNALINTKRETGGGVIIEDKSKFLLSCLIDSLPRDKAKDLRDTARTLIARWNRSKKELADVLKLAIPEESEGSDCSSENDY